MPCLLGQDGEPLAPVVKFLEMLEDCRLGDSVDLDGGVASGAAAVRPAAGFGPRQRRDGAANVVADVTESVEPVRGV